MNDFSDMVMTFTSDEMEEHDKQVRADALTDLFCLAKEFAFDDGVDYSISLYDLDKLITELKGYE